jgi:hypothetical protein
MHATSSLIALSIATVAAPLAAVQTSDLDTLVNGLVTYVERMKPLSAPSSPTRELRYRETDDGGLIRDVESRQMRAHGSAWVDDKGRLWRVTLELEHAHEAILNRRTADNELRVDFADASSLGMLLPREMRETFALRGGGRFDGRATYSNFKRFTTAARILPQ